MVDKTYTFPVKASGPSNCMASDSQYYGTNKFTWNFDIHFPVLTQEYVIDATGENTVNLQNGDTEKAEAELLKIARLTKSYIMSQVSTPAHRLLEYRIAKDQDLLADVLQIMIEVLQTWGGYDSLYTVESSGSEKSIGEAAKNYIKSLDLFYTYYNWSIDNGDYRKDY